MRILALAVLCGATFAVSALALQLIGGLALWAPTVLPSPLVELYNLALLGLPTAAAWYVGRRLARRWGSRATHPRKRMPRTLAWIVASAYLLTALLGIPAAQSRRDAWAVSEYKRLRASGSPRVWDTHPYVRTYVAIPVLPCLILSFHEYQLDGVYGLGAFELAVWYGSGVVAVDAWPLWVS